MKKLRLLILFLLAVTASYFALSFKIFPKNEVRAWTVTDEPVYVSQLKGFTPGPYKLNRPIDLDVDSNGNIYVADTWNQLIRKYNSNGVYIKSFGGYGTENGQFKNPVLAIDGDYVYVAENLGNRIQVFTLDGQFVTKWGQAGSGDGEFNMPAEIAAFGDSVYVVDVGNYRIQKFDRQGNFITKWGSNGTGDLQFKYPTGISVDASGNVYTLDSTNRRIQKFDSNGTFITKWGTSGSGDGQFSLTFGLHVDRANSVIYAADRGNYRVQKFDLNGNFLTKWGGTSGIETGQFYALYNVATDPSGNVYTVEDFVGRIQKFTNAGIYISSFGDRINFPVEFHSPMSVFADKQRNIYVAASIFPGGDAISVYSSSGTFITSWGQKGSAEGQFSSVSMIREGKDGQLYLADNGNYRVQVFQKDGTYVKSIGGQGSADGKLGQWIYAIDIDNDGNIYVGDYSNYRIQVFDKDGNFLRKWGSMSATEDGKFRYLYALAVDPVNGWVYEGDGSTNRIQKFDLQGNFIKKWTVPGESIMSLSVDSEGYVYLYKNTAGEYVKFDSDGNEILTFGTSGTADGKVQRPQGYYWSPDELLLYVADVMNNRIQIFSYDRTPATFDITTGGDGKVHVGDYLLEQSVQDDMSGIINVQYKVDGHGGWITCNPKDGSWGDKNEQFECLLNRQLGDGVYTVQFKSTDSFTNTGTVLGVSVAVDTKADDLRVTKVGTLTNTLNSDHLTYYYSQTSLTITGTAEPYSTVTFKVGGHTYTTTADSTGKFNKAFNDNQLDLGTNDVTYYYTDMAGNKSEEKIITLVLGEQYYPTWLTDSGKKEDLINDDEDAQPNNPPTDNTDNNSNNGTNNGSNNSDNSKEKNDKSSTDLFKKLSDWIRPSCCLLPLFLIILIAVILYYNKRRKEARKQDK